LISSANKPGLLYHVCGVCPMLFIFGGWNIIWCSDTSIPFGAVNNTDFNPNVC